MSANLTITAIEDLDGDMFGAQAITGIAAGSGRSLILDGTNDYLTNTNTGTAVSSNQVGWRAMFRVRGLTNPSGLTWLFHEFSGETLQLTHDVAGSFGGIVAVVIGAGFFSPGFVTLPAADCIILARSNPASTEISLEAWDLAGANRVGVQNTSASASGTNFQSRSIAIGATTAGASFMTGKIDKALFITGAGTYNAAAPDVEGTTGDIFNWTFDADDGTDSTGHASLTLNGSPAFESTP